MRNLTALGLVEWEIFDGHLGECPDKEKNYPS